MLKGRASKARPSNTSPPKIGGETPVRKAVVAVGRPWDYRRSPSDARWKHRGNTVKTPWTTRIIPTPGAVATAVLTADDGHELSADLYGKGHRAGEPHSLMVVCHPRTVPDGDVGRHPTFPEVIDAGDLLAPGDVFHIVFVCTPAGVEREAVDFGGALGVQADQVGEAKTKPQIVLARA